MMWIILIASLVAFIVLLLLFETKVRFIIWDIRKSIGKSKGQLNGIIKISGSNDLLLKCEKCKNTQKRRLYKDFESAYEDAKNDGYEILSMDKHKNEEAVVSTIKSKIIGGTATGEIFRCSDCYRLICAECGFHRCPYCHSHIQQDALGIIVTRKDKNL